MGSDEIIQSSIDIADSYLSSIRTVKDSALKQQGFSESISFSNLSACAQVKSARQKAAKSLSTYDSALSADLENFMKIATMFDVQDKQMTYE